MDGTKLTWDDAAFPFQNRASCPNRDDLTMSLDILSSHAPNKFTTSKQSIIPFFICPMWSPSFPTCLHKQANKAQGQAFARDEAKALFMRLPNAHF